MTKEELAQLSMMIITYSGVSKSNALVAMDLAKERKFRDAKELLLSCDETMKLAAQEHFKAIQLDATNELKVDVLFIHAEDQMMNAESIVVMATKTIELFESILK